MRCNGFDVELEALTAFLCVQIDGVRHIVEWRDAMDFARFLEGRRMRFQPGSMDWAWDSARMRASLKTLDGHGGLMDREQARRLSEGVRKMREAYDDWRISQQADRWRMA